MSAASNVKVVAAREIRQRLRGKVLYVSTAIIVLAIFAIAIVSRLASGDDDGQRSVTIGVVGEVPADFDESLRTAGTLLDISFETEPAPTMDAGEQLLADDDVEAVVVADDGRLLFTGDEDTTVSSALQQAWATSQVRQSLAADGLSPARIDVALSPEPLTPTALDVDSDEPDGVSVVVGTLTGILLFISIQMFGNMILMGVVEEKTTAVIELLLARVRATQLLAGKVLGIGAVAVAQLVIVVLAGTLALGVSGSDVPAGVWAALPWTAVWFTLGFALYAFLFALAGSLVSRQEDATAAVTPVGIVLTAGYLGVFILVGVPDSLVARLLSFVPPFTPLLMPLRIAAGAAPWYDIVLALVLLAATIVAIAKLAGRIYTALVLRRGARVSWTDALRSTA